MKKSLKYRIESFVSTLIGALFIVAFVATVLHCSEVKAGNTGFYAGGGFFAFDDRKTIYDYNGLSPLGIYELKYKWQFTQGVFVDIGYRHQSSAGYRERGSGFNGVFADFEVKLF